MKYDDNIIGFRLKKLRISKGMTAKQVAEKMGVSPSYISMLENGKSNYSLKTLMKLMSIYNENLSDFLKFSKSTGRVRHLEDMEQLSQEKNSVDYRLIRCDGDPDIFRPYYFHLMPGGDTGCVQHEGVEYIVVVEGSVVATLIDPDTGEQEDHILNKWDSIYYPSNFTHSVRNVSSEPSTFLLVFSPYKEDSLPGRNKTENL